MKKVSFKFQNWFQKNTPKFWQILGDIGLLASFLSTNLLLWKTQIIELGFTALANNPIFDRINAYALAIGVTIKFITKFFGKKPVNNIQFDEPQSKKEIDENLKRM